MTATTPIPHHPPTEPITESGVGPPPPAPSSPYLQEDPLQVRASEKPPEEPVHAIDGS